MPLKTARSLLFFIVVWEIEPRSFALINCSDVQASVAKGNQLAGYKASCAGPSFRPPPNGSAEHKKLRLDQQTVDIGAKIAAQDARLAEALKRRDDALAKLTNAHEPVCRGEFEEFCPAWMEARKGCPKLMCFQSNGECLAAAIGEGHGRPRRAAAVGGPWREASGEPCRHGAGSSGRPA
ncbi:hypothetical protein RvY_11768 [Ramazzottius varieornatus]|uniref:Uncharacterized protein n=1 Tax=Ramazzottius varieornatus TaxID=947166 RepID=A0A1D1VR11_RAMVA|nr:hypothetical protein RvY_11768 [Ramazzottius varieornatus]